MRINLQFIKLQSYTFRHRFRAVMLRSAVYLGGGDAYPMGTGFSLTVCRRFPVRCFRREWLLWYALMAEAVRLTLPCCCWCSVVNAAWPWLSLEMCFFIYFVFFCSLHIWCSAVPCMSAHMPGFFSLCVLTSGRYWYKWTTRASVGTNKHCNFLNRLFPKRSHVVMANWHCHWQ